MKVKPSDIEQYLNILDQTPRHIAQLCQDLEQERLSISPESGGWSLLEILAHLRACDDVWSHTIYAMLAMEQPILPKTHPKAWLNVTRYDALDFSPIAPGIHSQTDRVVGDFEGTAAGAMG